jgi:hypothetical protein
MIIRIVGYDPEHKQDLPKGKLSIRWRKESATYVIYVAGKILESGFGSEHEANMYLEERFGWKS